MSRHNKRLRDRTDDDTSIVASDRELDAICPSDAKRARVGGDAGGAGGAGGAGAGAGAGADAPKPALTTLAEVAEASRVSVATSTSWVWVVNDGFEPCGVADLLVAFLNTVAHNILVGRPIDSLLHGVTIIPSEEDLLRCAAMGHEFHVEVMTACLLPKGEGLPWDKQMARACRTREGEEAGAFVHRVQTLQHIRRRFAVDQGDGMTRSRLTTGELLHLLAALGLSIPAAGIVWSNLPWTLACLLRHSSGVMPRTPFMKALQEVWHLAELDPVWKFLGPALRGMRQAVEADEATVESTTKWLRAGAIHPRGPPAWHDVLPRCGGRHGEREVAFEVAAKMLLKLFTAEAANSRLSQAHTADLVVFGVARNAVQAVPYLARLAWHMAPGGQGSYVRRRHGTMLVRLMLVSTLLGHPMWLFQLASKYTTPRLHSVVNHDVSVRGGGSTAMRQAWSNIVRVIATLDDEACLAAVASTVTAIRSLCATCKPSVMASIFGSGAVRDLTAAMQNVDPGWSPSDGCTLSDMCAIHSAHKCKRFVDGALHRYLKMRF